MIAWRPPRPTDLSVFRHLTLSLLHSKLNDLIKYLNDLNKMFLRTSYPKTATLLLHVAIYFVKIDPFYLLFFQRTLTWLTSYGDRTLTLVREERCSTTATVRRRARRRSPSREKAKTGMRNRRAGGTESTCRRLSRWTERREKVSRSRLVDWSVRGGQAPVTLWVSWVVFVPDRKELMEQHTSSAAAVCLWF